MTTSTESSVELAINTIRTLSMDAVQKANSGSSGHADGARPTGLHALHAGHEAQPGQPGLVRPRPLRPVGGPRLDAPLLDALPGRVRASRSTTSRTSASSAARPRATPSTSTTTPRGSRPPPARSARGSRCRSGWRSPSGCSPPASTPATRPDRPPHLRDRERRRHPGGRGLRGLLAGGPPRPRQADRLLRQQPHPARGPDRPRLLARTWASATRPTAGTCRTWARTSRVETLESATEEAKGVEDKPSLVIVRSHIGYGSPEQAGHLPGARLAARRGRGEGSPRRSTAGRPTRPSTCPTRRASRSSEAAERGAAGRGGVGASSWPSFRDGNSDAAAELDLIMNGPRLPDGWDEGVPTFDPDDDDDRHAQGVGRGDPVGGAAGCRT